MLCSTVLKAHGKLLQHACLGWEFPAAYISYQPDCYILHSLMAVLSFSKSALGTLCVNTKTRFLWCVEMCWDLGESSVDNSFAADPRTPVWSSSTHIMQDGQNSFCNDQQWETRTWGSNEILPWCIKKGVGETKTTKVWASTPTCTPIPHIHAEIPGAAMQDQRSQRWESETKEAGSELKGDLIICALNILNVILFYFKRTLFLNLFHRRGFNIRKTNCCGKATELQDWQMCDKRAGERLAMAMQGIRCLSWQLRLRLLEDSALTPFGHAPLSAPLLDRAYHWTRCICH